MNMDKFASVIAELELAVKALEPPFLALPEDGHTLESLAYQRGARDAYQNVVLTSFDSPPYVVGRITLFGKCKTLWLKSIRNAVFVH